VISTVQSSIKGGLMFARGLLHFIEQNGLYSVKHEDTYVDEVLGFILAAAGFYTQASLLWNLPLAVDILLSPFHALESVLTWSVQWMDLKSTTAA
jgi:hypothetical protein